MVALSQCIKRIECTYLSGADCALAGELENMMKSRHLLDNRTMDDTAQYFLRLLQPLDE